MSIHNIKKIAALVPQVTELVGLTKKASLDEEFPTGDRNETLLSALETEFLMKVAGQAVDVDKLDKVYKAVDLYDLSSELSELSGSMVKAASHKEVAGVESIQNLIETEMFSHMPNLEKIASASGMLYDRNPEAITSDVVKLYAGAGTLDKSAAVLALNHRAGRTGNSEFTKVAGVIKGVDGELTVEENRSIINAVTKLEKASSYNESDFVKECFHLKQAELMIKLASKSVPQESLIKIAGNVGDVLGSEIGELLKEAGQNKDAIEALPLGERQVMEELVG